MDRRRHHRGGERRWAVRHSRPETSPVGGFSQTKPQVQRPERQESLKSSQLPTGLDQGSGNLLNISRSIRAPSTLTSTPWVFPAAIPYSYQPTSKRRARCTRSSTSLIDVAKQFGVGTDTVALAPRGGWGGDQGSEGVAPVGMTAAHGGQPR